MYLSIFCIIFTILVYSRVILPWQETREDLQTIHDIFHDLFPLKNVSNLITTLHYISHITSIIYLLVHFNNMSVDLFYYILWSFVMVIWTRMSMIVLLPLEAPYNSFNVNDQFVQTFLVDIPEFRNDLFFSGHVASMLTWIWISVSLSTHIDWILALQFLNVFIIGFLMCFTKVHYTIDIVCAWPISFACVKFTQWILFHQ